MEAALRNLLGLGGPCADTIEAASIGHRMSLMGILHAPAIELVLHLHDQSSGQRTPRQAIQTDRLRFVVTVAAASKV